MKLTAPRRRPGATAPQLALSTLPGLPRISGADFMTLSDGLTLVAMRCSRGAMRSPTVILVGCGVGPTGQRRGVNYAWSRANPL